MTNAIEQTRRDMYKALHDAKIWGCTTQSAEATFNIFETRLEAYLEALRKAMVTINESTVSCAQHSAEAFLDLETRLARMTEERNELRNKLQAFEFANRSAAELLSEALREPSGLRNSAGSMVHQNQPEFVSQDDSEGMPGYQFSWEECKHVNIYKDIAAGPRHYRCVDCGARGKM